jgi:hypothetical protein
LLCGRPWCTWRAEGVLTESIVVTRVVTHHPQSTSRAESPPSSKPAGRGSPTVGRFDSCAAPLSPAIPINASRHEVWQWLVQVGFGEAGFYSNDLLDNAPIPAPTTSSPGTSIRKSEPRCRCSRRSTAPPALTRKATPNTPKRTGRGYSASRTSAPRLTSRRPAIRLRPYGGCGGGDPHSVTGQLSGSCSGAAGTADRRGADAAVEDAAEKS